MNDTTADGYTFHAQYFFGGPHPTIEAAQALHTYDLFNCAAIFQTPAGTFVYGQLREMDSPPHKTAQAIKAACGYTMVCYHGPLINRWHPYEAQS